MEAKSSRLAWAAPGERIEEVLLMLRRLCILTLAATCVVGFALAGEMKEANGTVKSVEQNGFTVTDSNAKDWTFAVDKDTLVLAKGASHKMDKLKDDGKLPTIGEFVSAKQAVYVKYTEKDGKMVAKEIRIKGAKVE
jgi:hypothetical protein